jgi:hypothetical protein
MEANLTSPQTDNRERLRMDLHRLEPWAVYIYIYIYGAEGKRDCAHNYQAAHPLSAKQQESNGDDREDPGRAHDSRPGCKKGPECPALFAHSQKRTAKEAPGIVARSTLPRRCLARPSSLR